MYHDPYDGAQIKTYRRDPTGRWSPIVEPDNDSTFGVVDFGIVLVFAVIVAALIVWGDVK